MLKHAYLFLFVLTATCQKQDTKTGIDLPGSLDEVSGNEVLPNAKDIWMHNDSGNSSKLYRISDKGKLLEKIYLDADNEDWEDITSDAEGNLYVGDFGNNSNDRKDLKILKVPFSSLNSKDEIKVETISFHYEDQKKFPPKKKKLYFDCEAFFYFNDSLYLFTKSRVKDNYGKSNMYKIPAKKGHHVAKYVDSHIFGDTMHNWVTAADIRNDNKQIAILTHKDIWLFDNFKGDDFFNGKATKIPIKHLTQKEGICYKNDHTLLVTDENDHGRGGNLYEYKIN